MYRNEDLTGITSTHFVNVSLLIPIVLMICWIMHYINTQQERYSLPENNWKWALCNTMS